VFIGREDKVPGIIAKRAVVRVGEGRGFIVEHRVELPRFQGRRMIDVSRLVVTATHCLPFNPNIINKYYELPCPNLLGSLDGSVRNVWAQCIFADSVSDIAVLDSPYNQSFPEQSEAYEELTGAVSPLQIAPAPQKGHAWLLMLNGTWRRFPFERTFGGRMFINDQNQIKGGMSGSPIISDGMRVIAVVSGGSNGEAMEPCLTRDLPVWLLPRRRNSQR